MAASGSHFVCQECGHSAFAWTGRCPGCGEWNTLVEVKRSVAPRSGRRGRVAPNGSGTAAKPVPLREVEAPRADRLLTGILELDRVLGGGLVPGSLVLLGGSPGIGKSTLTGMALGNLSAAAKKALYVSGEESAAQVRLRAERLGCAVVLVGHVTKEGAVAGPRVLEHLVDCVLFFEGERERSYRPLRALKNRFGATSEVGVFEMRSGGLVEVDDPSARFVGEASTAPGSCVLCSMEGTRPLLVEVQALVAPPEIAPPRRVPTGIDRNRLAMVLAVLARNGGPSLGAADVFVNVAGGVRVDEPGADLAVALAIASAHRGEPLRGGDGKPLACFGEVGLTGELRFVAHPERRVGEALKFGLGPVLGPGAGERIEGLAPQPNLVGALRQGSASRPVRRAA